MELLFDIDLNRIQALVFWALCLLLAYLAIGFVWGYWLGKLKDEMGEAPTLAESFRRLISSSKTR